MEGWCLVQERMTQLFSGVLNVDGSGYDGERPMVSSPHHAYPSRGYRREWWELAASGSGVRGPGIYRLPALRLMTVRVGGGHRSLLQRSEQT